MNKAAKVHTRTKALIHSCWNWFQAATWVFMNTAPNFTTDLAPLYKHKNIHFCQHQNKLCCKKRSTLSQGNIKNGYTTILYTPGNFARKRESNTTSITQTSSNAFPLLNHWVFCCARRLGDQSLDRTRVYDWACLPTQRNVMLAQNKDYLWILRTLFIICI